MIADVLKRHGILKEILFLFTEEKYVGIFYLYQIKSYIVKLNMIYNFIFQFLSFVYFFKRRYVH